MNLLFLISVVSGLIGLVVCVPLTFSKQPRSAINPAAIFFGGPSVIWMIVIIVEAVQGYGFEQGRKEVKELCAKYGGDKIYKTVDNVEGVFQMHSRREDHGEQYRDEGMYDPWGFAQGVTIPLGTHGRGYLFAEKQPEFGKPEGPPYRRIFLRLTGKKNGDTNPYGDFPDDPRLLPTNPVEVRSLLSRYGYFNEDLTTPEMRKHWVAGGRIKIIDLQTKEVLAERTGYFLAEGPRVKDKWSGAAAQQNDRMCPRDGHLGGFLLSVLKPIQTLPTNDQLNAIAKE